MTDDLSAYRNYRGAEPPEVEKEKFRLSSAAQQLTAGGDYISAAEKKLELARICRSQGKHRDSHLLEVSARALIDKAANERGQYGRAAEALKNWASRLRANGLERDAYLLDVTASEYHKRSMGRP
jgi:hypothetical protein